MTYNTLTTPLRRCPDLQKVRKSRNYSSLRPRETCANCLFRCLSPYLVRSIRIDVQSHTPICASQNVYMYRPKRLYVSPCPIGGTTIIMSLNRGSQRAKWVFCCPKHIPRLLKQCSRWRKDKPKCSSCTTIIA